MTKRGKRCSHLGPDDGVRKHHCVAFSEQFSSAVDWGFEGGLVEGQKSAHKGTVRRVPSQVRLSIEPRQLQDWRAGYQGDTVTLCVLPLSAPVAPTQSYE